MELDYPVEQSTNNSSHIWMHCSGENNHTFKALSAEDNRKTITLRKIVFVKFTLNASA